MAGGEKTGIAVFDICAAHRNVAEYDLGGEKIERQLYDRSSSYYEHLLFYDGRNDYAYVSDL